MKISIAFLSLFLLTNSFAQSIEENIARAENMMDAYQETDALAVFEDVLRVDPNNKTALIKASFLNSIVGNRQKSADAKKPYFEKAMKYAKKGVQLNPKSAEAHFTYALALGRISQLAESEERLKYAKLIKEEGEIAIRLDKNYAPAYHVLAVLNMEIANLAWYKVAAAKLIYDGIPEGCTYAKAEQLYLKAIELRPNYILYQLEAAKNYEYWDKDSKAVELLQKTVLLKPITPDDPQRLADAKALLNRLR